MYTSDTISYYNNLLETTYKSLCDNNPNNILFLANEEFEDTNVHASFSSQLFNFLKQLNIVITALFVKISTKIKTITKQYDTLFNKYYKELSDNKNNIDTEDFYNTKIAIAPYIVTYKRIKTIQQLFAILDNMDSILNASGSFETPEMKRAFDLLIDIGFDAQNQSLINKSTGSYKNDTITQSVYQHMYTVDKLLSLIDSVKSMEKYTKYSWTVNLRRKFDNVSNKLTNEKRVLDKDNTTKANELQTKIKRLWWCSHFIKAAYTITNDVCKDLVKLSHEASMNIVRSRTA